MQINPIAKMTDWHQVASDLQAEELKLASYDNSLVPLLGDVTKRTILDYGAGPGVLALGLHRLGANIHCWDLNPSMQDLEADKIGSDRVYRSVENLPSQHFEHVICNLVVCIVPELVVTDIATKIHQTLRPDGRAWVGFCNPQIFGCEESQLDYRFPTGAGYGNNHDYRKIKKEGGYEIIETHRPIGWYEVAFANAGFATQQLHFTPAYAAPSGSIIRDFVIFELKPA